MSKVLVIKAHPNTSKSLSLIVGKEFINSYKKSHPDDHSRSVCRRGCTAIK